MTRKRTTDPETEPMTETPETDVETVEEAPAPRRRQKGVPAETIGQQIADGITQGLAQMAPKRIKPGSALFDPKSPFRSKKGPRLRGSLYQNGILCNEDQMYDAEITLANQINTSGRYINRLVEVILSDDAGVRVVLIKYPDKTIDQRMENKNHWRSFQELLEIIVRDQKKIVAA